MNIDEIPGDIIWLFKYLFNEVKKDFHNVMKPVVCLYLVMILLWVDIIYYKGEHKLWISLAGLLIFLRVVYLRMDWVAFKREMTYRKLGIKRFKP